MVNTNKKNSFFTNHYLTISCSILLAIGTVENVIAQQTAISEPHPLLSQILSGKGLKQHDFFYAGEAKNRNMYIVRNGKIKWSYIDTVGKGEISDAILMKNEHVLFAHQYGVTLIDWDKKVLWNYDAPNGFEVHTAQMIGKNHVVFIQNGNPAKVIVMDIHTNKIEKEFNLPFKSSTHGQIRHARLTEAGTLLVAHMDLGKVCEYDMNGKTLLSLDVPGIWSAVPMGNGHILATSNQGFVREITRAGDIVWECKVAEIPDYKISSPQIAVRLSNGNTLINNWFNQWDNKNVSTEFPAQAVEVTADKKVVWVLHAWDNPINLGPSTVIQLLNDKNTKVKDVHFGQFK